MRVGAVALVHAREELLAVLAVLGVRVDLVHEAVLVAVLARRPVGGLVNERLQLRCVLGRAGHELVLHLGHAVRRGLHDEVVEVVEVGVERRRRAAARLGQGLDAGAAQAAPRVRREARLHELGLLALVGFLVANPHWKSASWI